MPAAQGIRLDLVDWLPQGQPMVFVFAGIITSKLG